MHHPLSKRQLETLDALRAFGRREGRMPSVRELAERLGLAPTTTHQHLKALEGKGYLRSDGTAHGLRLVDPRSGDEGELVRVPLRGSIAAGEPIEAIERDDEDLRLPRDFAPPGCYALRVRGESMIDDHILDGDVVLIRPQDRVERGQIAVALLEDGTATLKRVYPEKGRIRLQPANARMAPLYVKRLRIQGRVVAVLRRHD